MADLCTYTAHGKHLRLLSQPSILLMLLRELPRALWMVFVPVFFLLQGQYAPNSFLTTYAPSRDYSSANSLTFSVTDAVSLTQHAPGQRAAITGLSYILELRHLLSLISLLVTP